MIILTQIEVIPYLQRCKLISAESIVEGDVGVVDASRRNRNFKVIRKRGTCYLLKQGVGPEGIATIANEAAVYQHLWSDSKTGELQRYLPRFYGYDSEECILILEFLQDTQDLRDYYIRRGRFSKTLAATMGNALGALHQKKKSNDDMHVFTLQPPWVLFLHQPDLRIFRNISSANLQVIEIIQQSPEFCELLDELSQEWRVERFIHFDIKGDNCIVSTRSFKRQKNGLKIIDWELSGLGDPCWDVGSVFNDYLSSWLLSIPITEEISPERFPEIARYPLAKMQPAIRSFWEAYTKQMKLDAMTSNEWLLRSIRYGAARLVQTTYEQMQMAMELTGNIVCFLQLSLNILQRPQEAIVHLLGIPLQGR